MLTNNNLLEIVRDITVARMSNTNMPCDKDGGQHVADFMQAIYDKLVELNKYDN